jgi:hypothetical protein
MDALYLYKHSKQDDSEILYSLRSLERYAPYIRKVWIFGDRPHFLSNDRSIVECVPHSDLAGVLGVSVPVTNSFLLLALSSLIPELEFEYLKFSDDYVLMRDYPPEEARKDRFLEDLSQVSSRSTGLWIDSLWRTYDVLARLGYSGFNFEIHAPTYLTKRRALEAYRDFRDFVTEDRWFGMLGPTAILNHAVKHGQTQLVNIVEEESRLGYIVEQPRYEDIVLDSEGKTFLFFDDEAFGPAIRRFLEERFPTPSRYEQT